jgi:hypothetical protein
MKNPAASRENHLEYPETNGAAGSFDFLNKKNQFLFKKELIPFYCRAIIIICLLEGEGGGAR